MYISYVMNSQLEDVQTDTFASVRSDLSLIESKMLHSTIAICRRRLSRLSSKRPDDNICLNCNQLIQRRINFPVVSSNLWRNFRLAVASFFLSFFLS